MFFINFARLRKREKRGSKVGEEAKLKKIKVA